VERICRCLAWRRQDAFLTYVGWMLPIYWLDQFKGRIFFNWIPADEFGVCTTQNN